MNLLKLLIFYCFCLFFLSSRLHGLPCDPESFQTSDVEYKIQERFKMTRKRGLEAGRKFLELSKMVEAQAHSFAKVFPDAFKKFHTVAESYGAHSKHWDIFFPVPKDATWLDFSNGIGNELKKIHEGLLATQNAMNLFVSENLGETEISKEMLLKTRLTWEKHIKSYSEKLNSTYMEIYKELPSGLIHFEQRSNADKVINFGKRIDAILAEMRLAFLLPNVSAVNAFARDLVDMPGMKPVPLYYHKREFDIIYVGNGRVMFADAKAYDRVYDGRNTDRKNKLINQIKAQLTIVNSIPGCPIGVEFYFFGGIIPSLKKELEDLAADFIKTIRPDDFSSLKFLIHGEEILDTY